LGYDWEVVCGVVVSFGVGRGGRWLVVEGNVLGQTVRL
jgi:hypothetical protein